MDASVIIALLRQDMMDEQQAIIQYLNHAYAMPEGALPAQIEAIAREEMYHLDWLADCIVSLGGDPAMERTPPDLTPGAPQQQMLKDVDLEQGAIDQYRAHIALIDDEQVRRLLARILQDELVHQEQFRTLAEEAAVEPSTGDGPSADASAAPSARLGALLNAGIRHEYSVVLQYLYHSFVTEECEAAEELQTAAINEMQHLGWLAEHLSEEGGQPDFAHGSLVLTRDLIANLRADVQIENDVTKMYSAQVPEVEDATLQKLLTRIRNQEIYHEEVFSHLLAEAETAAQAKPPCCGAGEPQEPQNSAPTIPTVGSLKD